MSQKAVNDIQIPDMETLQVTVCDRVAVVYLNRPHKANAMNPAMWKELKSCFTWLDETPQVRAVVLAAEGKLFCAGMDLASLATLMDGFSEDAGRNGELLRRTILSLQDSLTAIERCRKPVLAAIHGKCLGGAIDMITACDMRYATDDAVFCVKETEIGMAADVGTLQRLPKLIPAGIARELCYTARDFSALEAREFGLVNCVYADRETMLTAVLEIAGKIAGHSPLAVRGTKEMLNYARDHSVQDSLNYVATWNAHALMSTDMQRTLVAKMTGETVEYED